jgi:hypothetical protein
MPGVSERSAVASVFEPATRSRDQPSCPDRGSPRDTCPARQVPSGWCLFCFVRLVHHGLDPDVPMFRQAADGAKGTVEFSRIVMKSPHQVPSAWRVTPTNHHRSDGSNEGTEPPTPQP